MVREEPKKPRNGSGGAQKREWSQRTPKRLKNGLGSLKRLETVGEKQAKKWPEKGSEGGVSPVLEGGPGCTSKSLAGARVARATVLGVLGGGAGCTSNGPWGGGQVAPAKGLGFRVFTFDTQRLDRLDGQCGPYLALERPAAPALPGLHVQCSQVAREARTASGSQVLVASPQQRL